MPLRGTGVFSMRACSISSCSPFCLTCFPPYSLCLLICLFQFDRDLNKLHHHSTELDTPIKDQHVGKQTGNWCLIYTCHSNLASIDTYVAACESFVESKFELRLFLRDLHPRLPAQRFQGCRGQETGKAMATPSACTSGGCPSMLVCGSHPPFTGGTGRCRR